VVVYIIKKFNNARVAFKISKNMLYQSLINSWFNIKKKDCMFPRLFARIALAAVIITPLIAEEFNALSDPENVFDKPWPEILTHTLFPVELKISGYVKGEGIWDTRQNETIRDGQFLYFPLEKLPDVNGADINARGTFDAYAIQTRVILEGKGPDISCNQSGFLIEGDFFGRTDVTLATFTMRLAYLYLVSDHYNFLAGQFWHPLCFPFDFPETISFNEGVPIAPFALVPEFCITYHNDYVSITGSLIGFLGDRPFGPTNAGDRSFRDAIMPDLNLLIQIKYDDDNFVGADFDVMRIVPRLVTNNNVKEVNPFTAFSATAFSCFFCEPFVWANKFIYAEDASIFEMIGGFAVHTVDPVTDLRTYTPLRTASFFTEFIRRGDIEPAIFAGYVKNLGASKTIIPNLGPDNTSGVYSLGPNIDHVWRVSPRIRWYIKSFVVGVELEYTQAAYGIINNHGGIDNATPVGNTRFLFAAYYFF
jgi:hypothetical protein